MRSRQLCMRRESLGAVLECAGRTKKHLGTTERSPFSESKGTCPLMEVDFSRFHLSLNSHYLGSSNYISTQALEGTFLKGQQ